MIQIYQESTPFTNKRVDSPISQNTFLNPVIMPFALNTTLGTNVLETVFYIKNDSIEHYYEDIVISLMREDEDLNTALTSGAISNDRKTFSVNSYKRIPISLAFETSKVPNILDGKYQHNYIPICEGNLITDSLIADSTEGSYVISAPSVSGDNLTGFNISVGDKISGDGVLDNTYITELTGSWTVTGGEENIFSITLSKPVMSTILYNKFAVLSKNKEDLIVKFNYDYDQISDYDWGKLNSILVIPYIGNSTTPNTSYIPIRMRIEWVIPPSIYTTRKYFLDVSYSTEGKVI